MNGEGGNLLSVEIDNLASVGRGIIGADHLQGLVPVVVEVRHGGAQQEVRWSGEGRGEVRYQSRLRGEGMVGWVEGGREGGGRGVRLGG